MKRKDFIKTSALSLVATSFSSWSFAKNQTSNYLFQENIEVGNESFLIRVVIMANSLVKGGTFHLTISNGYGEDKLEAKYLLKLNNEYQWNTKLSVSYMPIESEYIEFENKFGNDFSTTLPRVTHMLIGPNNQGKTFFKLYKNDEAVIVIKEDDYNITDCYLTTLCVEHKGYLDDCYELTILRQFRDEYMHSSSEGTRLVQEYYSLGPQLLPLITTHPQRDAILDFMYNHLVRPSIKLIEEKKLDIAMEYYKEATLELLKRL